MNELDLFAAAIGITDPDERAALLERECGGRPEVRDRLDQLLDAHFKTNPLLDLREPERSGAFDGPGTTESVCIATEAEGTVIAGRFKLLQQIGEGGMGSVWMADQTEPVKRRVAVKLIRIERGNTRTILSRFEAERQAIALMDHPHIAKLLDAGTTAAGSPFFVMELVKGIPLNEYCDTHKLNIRDRLQLFTQICSAVQHAHQKGIIHRDLKPTNILVESHDGKPVPKVIDFGLAKATSGLQLSEHTLFTAFGSVMGTPLYMAPEQANFNAVDVDTRADVYALGVILFELLTGTTPITRESMKKAAIDEMLRLIREQEAPTPSSRLSTMESTPSIAANRQMEPRKLGRFIKGELDWIVMKALSKERDRRYETANEFARDVERFLTNEPIAAGPPSASYRLRKFVRRNRPQVIAASLVLFALLAGFAGTAFGLMRARQQQRIAEQAAAAELKAKQEADAKRIEAETQQCRAEAGEKLAGERLVQVEAEKKRTEEEKKRTEEEKQIALAVKDFLQKKLLGQADVREQANALLATGSQATAAKHDRTILELLNQAAQELSEAKIESNFPNQPILQAEVLDTVGTTYQGAGEPGRAIGFLQRSLALRKATLGLDQAVTLKTMGTLAVAYAKAGMLDLAAPLLEETLKLQKAKLGPDHPGTLITMSSLAATYGLAGRPDLAVPLQEEAFKFTKAKLGPDHLMTLTSMGNLAFAYEKAGKLDRAVPLHEETLRRRKGKLGPDHPDTLQSMNNLAVAYGKAGKLDLAIPLQEEAFRLTTAKLGPDHPASLTTMNTLAWAFWKAKQLGRSIPLLEKALKGREAVLGRDHPDTLMTVANLGVNYNDAGRYKEAIPLLEEAHRAATKYRELSWVGASLLGAYTKAGEQSKTADLVGELLSEARKTLPQESPQLAGQTASLGLSLLQVKAFTEAERLIRECLAIREKTQADVWNTFNTQSLLGGALLGQKKYAEAEPLLLKGYEGMKQRQKSIPPQGNTRIPEALDRLIDLYTATNKPDEVKKWQAERAKYPEDKPADKK
jgi:eukaryotic-like serine/threonine-protein kinase